MVVPSSPAAFIPQLTEGPRGMSRQSSLLVLAAGVVAAALLYHDWWGGPIYLQDSFRDRAVGLTADELRQLPEAGEPDRAGGDRWSCRRRTEDSLATSQCRLI